MLFMQAHENMDSESSIKSAPHYLRSESPRLNGTWTYLELKTSDSTNEKYLMLKIVLLFHIRGVTPPLNGFMPPFDIGCSPPGGL